jgi:hypothetical protein
MRASLSFGCIAAIGIAVVGWQTGCESTAGGTKVSIDYQDAAIQGTTTNDDESDAGLYGDGTGVDDASVPLPGDTCGAAASNYVYVIGVAAGVTEMYAFEPGGSVFHDLGTLTGCPPASATAHVWPTSIAVDEKGDLSVLIVTNYGMPSASGSIYPIDRTMLTCGSATALDSAAIPGSIAYAKVNAVDTLFFAGEVNGDAGLTYELGSLTIGGDGGPAALNTIGALALAPTKLTGTSDGRLFAAQAKQVAQVDPQTAANVTPLQNVMIPFDSSPGSAMAYFGGSLYFFEAIGTDIVAPNSAVDRYDLTSTDVTQMNSVPLYVTGAGVSSCASTTSP